MSELHNICHSEIFFCIRAKGRAYPILGNPGLQRGGGREEKRGKERGGGGEGKLKPWVSEDELIPVSVAGSN